MKMRQQMNKHHLPKPYDAPHNVTAYTDRQLSPRLRAGLKITDGGRLVIPAAMREAMGVGPGDTVSAICVDGELRLVRAEQLVKPGWADRFHDAMRKKKAEK